MNDSKDFQDAESVRSGNSHVSRRPVSFPLHPIPEGMLRQMIIKGSSDQVDHKRNESNNETYFQNSQTCSSIGCSIESIWNPKSKSNTITPKTKSQRFKPKEISHVMSGIICWTCLTSAISACVTTKSRPTMNLTARMPTVVSSSTSSNPGKTWYEYPDPGKSVVVIDRGNLTDSPKQDVQNRIVIVLGLFKSGKVKLRRTIDRGNLIELLGMRCNKFVLIMEMPFSTKMRIPWGTERWFMMDRSNLIVLITKKRQIPKLSSWEVTCL